MILSSLPSPKQLDQVYEAGMAIISPPPEHLVEFDEKKLAAVKGWLIGTALNRDQATELATTSGACRSIASSDETSAGRRSLRAILALRQQLPMRSSFRRLIQSLLEVLPRKELG